MRRTLSIVAATSVAAAFGSQAFAAPVPVVDRSQFGGQVQNAWFPLRPGTVYTYRGVKDALPVTDVLTVTHATKVIQGVRCTVVHDRLYTRGRLIERTTDWYATAKDATVWYFGEATATLDPKTGSVKSTDGSFQAGVDAASAGIYMPGSPRVGQSASQEYYKGHAEDHFAVLSFAARANTPAASSRHALLTKEFTPLEPGVLDHKVYVRGVGTVLEEAVKGPTERLVLQSVHRSQPRASARASL
jgi:hypothetical protein